jgi:hypothetical protein
LILAQVKPSPEYPGLQLQENEPSVSVQIASSWQLSVFDAHSFTFEHVVPSPE